MFETPNIILVKSTQYFPTHYFYNAVLSSILKILNPLRSILFNEIALIISIIRLATLIPRNDQLWHLLLSYHTIRRSFSLTYYYDTINYCSTPSIPRFVLVSITFMFILFWFSFLSPINVLYRLKVSLWYPNQFLFNNDWYVFNFYHIGPLRNVFAKL